MTVRFLLKHIVPAALLAAATLCGPVPVACGPVWAQNDDAGKEKILPQAPEQLPKVDSGRNLDFLFTALKEAPDAATARSVEARIWALWLQTPSDTAALLMSRAKLAVGAQKADVAMELLDAIIRLRPDYTEAFNRRATLSYMKNDYSRALADIEQVLIREPRHFAALTGLGLIMEDIGEDKRALEAYRQALAINPHLDKVAERVRRLSAKIEGRDL